MPDRTSHPPGTISWTDLATTDQEGAKAFYGGLFGWEYEDMPAGEDAIYSMAKLGGRSAAAISGAAAPTTRQQGIPPHWNLYVTVEDLDATVGKVAEAGGQVLRRAVRRDGRGPHGGRRGPHRRRAVPLAARHEHRRRGRQRARRDELGRPRHDRRAGRAGVLHRACWAGASSR